MNAFRALVLFTFVLSLPLFAATPDGSLETGTLEESTDGSVWSKVGMELYGWSYGSGLGQWDNRKPHADGTAGEPIEVWNQISVTYPTSSGMDFVVIPQFSFRPFLSTSDQGALELKDPTFGISGTLFQSGGWSLWARFENALPFSQSSRDSGMILSPGTFASLSYRFPRSGWEVLAQVNPSVSLMSNGDLQSYLYFSPRVNYIFNPEWALFGYMETATGTERAAGLMNFSQMQDTHVGMGVRYSFADLFVEPSINVYPFGDVQDSTTFVALFFGGRLK